MMLRLTRILFWPALLASSLYPHNLSAQNACSQQHIVQQLASHAHIIFRGTVLAVEHHPAAPPDSVATLQISFLVREAVRGVSAGKTLTIRLWEGGSRTTGKYRVGQNVIMLLHEPSQVSGLTSPVGGEAGRLLVDRYGTVTFSSGPCSATPPATHSVEIPGKQKRIPFRELLNDIRRSLQ